MGTPRQGKREFRASLTVTTTVNVYVQAANEEEARAMVEQGTWDSADPPGVWSDWEIVDVSPND